MLNCVAAGFSVAECSESSGGKVKAAAGSLAVSSVGAVVSLGISHWCDGDTKQGPLALIPVAV